MTRHTTATRALCAALLLLTACGSDDPSPSGKTADMSTAPDMRVVMDMSTGQDMRTADMPAAQDMTTAQDMTADMAPAPDMAADMSATPDMSTTADMGVGGDMGGTADMGTTSPCQGTPSCEAFPSEICTFWTGCSLGTDPQSGELICTGVPAVPCEDAPDQAACESVDACAWDGQDCTNTNNTSVSCAMLDDDQDTCETFGCTWTPASGM